MKRYLAKCGLFCGACVSMIAHEKLQNEPSALTIPIDPEESPCPGCGSPGLEDCEFIVCNRRHGIESCAFCPEFPCDKIVEFNNTEWPHHACVLDNLRRIREAGSDAWLAEQEQLWSCRTCGARTHWYQSRCDICGASWKAIFTLNSPES